MRSYSLVFHYLICIIIVLNLCTATRPGKCPFQRKHILPPNLQNAGDACSPGLKECDPNNVYYSLDGSCNNIDIPFWGQTNIPYVRLLPANYSDGHCAIRKSSDGSPLPLSRLVRTTVLENNEILDNKFNILYYSFGQWLGHDVTLSLPMTTDVPCCTNHQPSPHIPEDICLPTMIPQDDSFYSTFGVTCIDIKRSINTEAVGCKLTPCSQINFATAFIDLSLLYGMDNVTSNELRAHDKGQLKAENDETTSHQEYPPILSGGTSCPRGGLTPVPNTRCFQTADIRINQNPELAVMEIIFFRMHNYVAENLHKINPHWSDNRLYQEARRILIAMYQHIVFREHVPPLIGPAVTAHYKLFPASSGYVKGYNNRLNPQTVHSFEASVGRILHSMIRGEVQYENADGKSDKYLLRHIYFNYERLLLGKNMFSNIIHSYASQQCDSQDKFFSEEVNNWMFPIEPGREWGLDLSAIDIDRGRDHGLASYNDYRQACGLCRLKQFEDLKDDIKNPEDVEKIKSLYKSVDDIDLYVGCALEKPLPDAVVGPTAACVLGESFARWKFGDRIYYEFPGAKFTTGCLGELMTDEKIPYIAVPLFITNPNLSKNPQIRCDEVAKIKLELWKDQQENPSQHNDHFPNVYSV